MREIGYIPMPEAFKYRGIFLQGRPRHDRAEDLFRVRHPQMDTGRRAKIFAPFDALRGFQEALTDAAREAERGS